MSSPSSNKSHLLHSAALSHAACPLSALRSISQGSLNNGLCFVGPHRTYNPIAANYHQLIPGQGHFGPGKPWLRFRVG